MSALVALGRCLPPLLISNTLLPNKLAKEFMLLFGRGFTALPALPLQTPLPPEHCSHCRPLPDCHRPSLPPLVGVKPPNTTVIMSAARSSLKIVPCLNHEGVQFGRVISLSVSGVCLYLFGFLLLEEVENGAAGLKVLSL